MVQRFKEMQKLCTYTKIILSLNLSINSFESEEDTDIWGHDAVCFSSMDELIESLPTLISDGKICFIKTAHGIYIKNLKKIENGHKSKKEGATLFWLKSNSVDLVDTFTNIDKKSIHLYTELNIIQRFGNLQKYYDRPLAWCYHNECVCMALKQSDTLLSINDASKVWIFEDDLEYTGDIQDFLRVNEDRNFDLLGAFSHTVGIDYPFHVKLSTPKFKKMISHYKNVHKFREHLICMSGRYVKMMISLLNEGLNAVNEVSTIQYCYDAGMRYLDIEEKY